MSLPVKDNKYMRPKLTGDPLIDESRLVDALGQLQTALYLHSMPPAQILSELRKLMRLWDEYDDGLGSAETTPEIALLKANRARSNASCVFQMTLGAALGAAGKKKEACEAFDRARALDPEWSTAMEHYAEYLASIGDFARCAEVINTEPVTSIINKGGTTANCILSLIADNPELKRRVKPALIRLCRWLLVPAMKRRGSRAEIVIHLSDGLALPRRVFRGHREPKCVLRQRLHRTSRGMEPSGIVGT